MANGALLQVKSFQVVLPKFRHQPAISMYVVYTTCVYKYVWFFSAHLGVELPFQKAAFTCRYSRFPLLLFRRRRRLPFIYVSWFHTPRLEEEEAGLFPHPHFPHLERREGEGGAYDDCALALWRRAGGNLYPPPAIVVVVAAYMTGWSFTQRGKKCGIRHACGMRVISRSYRLKNIIRLMHARVHPPNETYSPKCMCTTQKVNSCTWWMSDFGPFHKHITHSSYYWCIGNVLLFSLRQL